MRRWALCGVAAVAWPLLARGAGGAEFPDLEQAVALARDRALVVADAQAELSAADAQVAGASVSSIGNPSTDVQVDRGLTTSTTIQALTFTYLPIDVAGQRGTRISEAERLVDWRRQGVVDARGIATGEVVAAYGSMLVVAARISETAAGEQAAREEARYFAARLQEKATTVYEQKLTEAEVARWVQSSAEARLGLVRQRARLSELTGILDLGVPAGGTGPAPPPLRRAWDDAHVAEVADRAPLVARLDAEKRYWDASVTHYRRERIPPLSLELIAGRGTLGETRLGGGAVLTFPMTRRYQGEIARAEHGRAEAETRRALYRTVIEARVRAARDTLTAVRTASAELNATALPALERAVAAATEAFKAGKIDLSRALLARRDLSLARARRLDLLEEGWRAYAELAAVVGDLP
jgi:outer membrane protein TolC